ncbi:hypothetical protein PT974_08017 [Cladobotryum mycophilum]|uniref:Uncharacterized protein n=1 Tax=Cladobotryum mycophilum TaxID=491253 RepID=A0ABR0SC48_9HYPO
MVSIFDASRVKEGYAFENPTEYYTNLKFGGNRPAPVFSPQYGGIVAAEVTNRGLIPLSLPSETAESFDSLLRASVRIMLVPAEEAQRQHEGWTGRVDGSSYLHFIGRDYNIRQIYDSYSA